MAARMNRSHLFIVQRNTIINDYRVRADSDTASRFADQVEVAESFIAKNPRACSVYGLAGGKELRKWQTKDFPVNLYFTIADNGDIVLEAIYHQSMNIAARLLRDIK